MEAVYSPSFFRGIFVDADEEIIAFNPAKHEVMVRKHHPKRRHFRKIDRHSSWTQLTRKEANEFLSNIFL